MSHMDQVSIVNHTVDGWNPAPPYHIKPYRVMQCTPPVPPHSILALRQARGGGAGFRTFSFLCFSDCGGPKLNDGE